MKLQNQKNNTHCKIHITRDNLFFGLPFPDRIKKCIDVVEGLGNQFINETSIMLDLARKSTSSYVACEAENDTDICAFLAQIDIEVKEISDMTQERLKALENFV